MTQIGVIGSGEDTMTLVHFMELITFERNEAERKRNLLRVQSTQFGKPASEAEIQRAGHEHELLAEAYYILLKKMTRRALEASPLKKDAAQLKLIEIDETTGAQTEIGPAPKTAVVQPKMDSPEAEKEKEALITNHEVDESIYEAYKLAEGRKGNEHWDIARSKVEHFYRDQLSASRTDKEIDAFIREVVNRVQTAKQRELEDEIGVERDLEPITDPNQMQKVQFVKGGNFNIAVLTGNKKHSNADRIKLEAIRLMTIGNKKRAVQVLRTFYAEKNWDEFTAEEYLKTLMRKDPLKELNTAVKGILAYNKTHKGDVKKGIKFCRSLVAAYLQKKYVTPAKGVTITPEIEKVNQTIDRIINRQLESL